MRLYPFSRREKAGVVRPPRLRNGSSMHAPEAKRVPKQPIFLANVGERGLCEVRSGPIGPGSATVPVLYRARAASEKVHDLGPGGAERLC
jgi:hypothetical protein